MERPVRRPRVGIGPLLAPALAGCLLVGGLALLADRASWLEAMANSFLPYVAVPLASGLLVPRSSRSYAGAAGLLGAASSVAMVATFYGANAISSPYALSTWGVFFWSAVAVISGSTLAVFAWWIQPGVLRHARTWAVASCLALVAAQVATIIGPSRYDAADVAGLAVVALLCCALNMLALRRLSRRSPHQLSRP